MATPEPTTTDPGSGRPLASLLREVLPPQGAWSDEAYLWLTDHSRRPIEFTDGHVQELPISTMGRPPGVRSPAFRALKS